MWYGTDVVASANSHLGVKILSCKKGTKNTDYHNVDLHLQNQNEEVEYFIGFVWHRLKTQNVDPKFRNGTVGKLNADKQTQKRICCKLHFGGQSKHSCGCWETAHMRPKKLSSPTRNIGDKWCHLQYASNKQHRVCLYRGKQ